MSSALRSRARTGGIILQVIQIAKRLIDSCLVDTRLGTDGPRLADRCAVLYWVDWPEVTDADGSSWSGSANANVDPLPTSLSTQIRPPWCRMTSRLM